MRLLLLCRSPIDSCSSQKKLFKMLSQVMQLSSKPLIAPHWHLKYIALIPVFKAPYELPPAFFRTSSLTTLHCLLCSICKLVTLLFLEQPHFPLPLRGMLFPQIHTWLAPSSWTETQEHCSKCHFLKEDSSELLVERTLPHLHHSLSYYPVLIFL